MGQIKPRDAFDADQPATPELPPAGELDFASLKIEPPSFTTVMGMLLGLSASQAPDQQRAGDLFSRVKARPQPDGSLLVVAPLAGGTQREIRVPAGHWRLLMQGERA
jgi:hypothetical protein